MNGNLALFAVLLLLGVAAFAGVLLWRYVLKDAKRDRDITRSRLRRRRSQVERHRLESER